MNKEESTWINMPLGYVIRSEQPSFFISDTKTEATISVQSVESPMPGSEKDNKYPPSLPIPAHKPRIDNSTTSDEGFVNNATPDNIHASTER
jgi:hypothetical protein